MDGRGPDGPYDQGFYDDIDDVHKGEEVTVSANVNEILTPEAFTVAGTDDTTVDALLVLHETTQPELRRELTVKVTGTVHTAFDLPAVEKRTSAWTSPTRSSRTGTRAIPGDHD